MEIVTTIPSPQLAAEQSPWFAFIATMTQALAWGKYARCSYASAFSTPTRTGPVGVTGVLASFGMDVSDQHFGSHDGK